MCLYGRLCLISSVRRKRWILTLAELRSKELWLMLSDDVVKWYILDKAFLAFWNT